MKLRLILLFLGIFTAANVAFPQNYYYSCKTTDSVGKKSYQLFLKNGKAVFDFHFDWAYVTNWDWIIVRNGQTKTAYDSLGNKLNIEGIQSLRSVWTISLYQPIKKNNLWGFYDRSGKLVIDHQYDAVTLFKNDIAAVKKDGKTFYINTRGEKIDKEYVPSRDYEFEDMEEAVGMSGFSNFPQVIFEENGKKGLKEKSTGKVIIPAEYDGLFNIQKNQITVELNGKFGVVDFENNVIIPLIYDEIFVID